MNYEDEDIDALLRDPFASAAVAALVLWMTTITVAYIATGHPWQHQTLVTWLCLPVAALGTVGSLIRAAIGWSTQRQVAAYRSQTSYGQYRG